MKHFWPCISSLDPNGMRAIRDRPQYSGSVSYTRGNDLSGSLEGAGGIGGLLARSDAGYGHNFYHADGNWNITFIMGTNQTRTGWCRYDPFGNTIFAAGTVGAANTYRFSSKMADIDTGLIYYGYRWYDPPLQRWPNRDPLGEPGGINLYRFVNNSPLNEIDPHGTISLPAVCCITCVALFGWDIYDAITDEICASKNGKEFVECVMEQALKNIADNCVAEAIVGGVMKGDSPDKIAENVIDCFKCDAIGAARDAGKVASCGCCIASLLRGRIPRIPPILPRPVPIPTGPFRP